MVSSKTYNNNTIDLIGKGWQLYRYNFKSIFLYNLIPITFFSAIQLILSLFVLYVFKGEYFTKMTVLSCSSCFMILIIFVAYSFFNFAQFKAFRNILTGQNYSYTYIFNETKKNISGILAILLILLPEILVLLFVDTILIFILIFFLSIITTVLAMISAVIPGVSIFFSFITAMFITFLFLSIIGSQLVLILLQLNVFAIESATEKKTKSGAFNLGVEAVSKSIQVFKSMPLKVIKFSFVLFFLWYVLVTFLKAPASILVYIVMQEHGLTRPDQLDPLLLISTNIYSSVIDFLIWPVITGCVAMFYFEWQKTKEGLDLFEAIKMRPIH